MTDLPRPYADAKRDREAERPHLERRYGDIGISAVAAAATLKKPENAPTAPAIAPRFEEEDS